MTRKVIALRYLLVSLTLIAVGVLTLLYLSVWFGICVTVVGVVAGVLSCQLLRVERSVARLKEELSHTDDGYQEFVRLLEEHK